MSSSPIQFQCTKCKKHGSNFLAAGQAAYVLRDGRPLRMRKTVGYCPRCDAFVAVDDVDVSKSQAALQEEMQELKRREEILEKMNASFWMRLWFNRHEIKNAQGFVDMHRKRVVEQEMHLELCQKRKGRASCLECGCWDAVPLVAPPIADLRAAGAVLMDFPHGECDGRLTVNLSQLRISMPWQPPRFYGWQGFELYQGPLPESVLNFFNSHG